LCSKHAEQFVCPISNKDTNIIVVPGALSLSPGAVVKGVGHKNPYKQNKNYYF